MNATTADRWISQIEIGREEIGQNTQNFDQIVEVDSAKDGMIFTIIDSLMVLVVYLGPVVAFGYLVAPVVARLLRMPISY
jgi:hypothetical protein